ncbi:putative membrane protein [Streptomyces sp. 1222.5]|nr:putative membrane protein [Streptomyces sp. 5112.2]SED26108.1 putative membrane protein [Streptomyces sp. 1222.5]
MTAVHPVPYAAPRRVPPAVYAAVAAAGLAVSAWGVRDRTTWFLETVWALIGLPLLVLLRRRFPLTGLLYGLLAVHALVLAMGGHYTYAQVPLGDWVRDTFGLARNPYDRFGHLMQGFVPAVLVRELLVRTSPLRGSRWLAPLTVCACLAFSACFELLEWAAAEIGGHGADAFLATQGDVWDTQWDMFCALIGSVLSLLLLSRVHDRRLRALEAAAEVRAGR